MEYKKCPSHEQLVDLLNEIRKDARGTRDDIKEMRRHFDVRHDKNIEAINSNKSDIAVLKVKQYLFAAIAGLGGSQVQEIIRMLNF